MPDNLHDREKEALEASPGLVAALKRAREARIFIPRTVDERILHTARRHLSRRTEGGFKWALLIRWGIAVAALALILAILPHFVRRPGSTSGAMSIQGDLNHDGQIDILDAFALARELKAGAHPSLQLDINADGVVDERDVAALAARAVSLERGGRS